ncbi:MAG: serine hydrolase, partial [Pseudomonadota bacterium]
SLIPPGDALRWNRIGGKGGSEPGVVAFAFLTQAKSGKTYAISGSWNNTQQPVDNAKFLTLMNRLLNLVAK